MYYHNENQIFRCLFNQEFYETIISTVCLQLHVTIFLLIEFLNRIAISLTGTNGTNCFTNFKVFKGNNRSALAVVCKCILKYEIKLMNSNYNN